MDQRVVDALTEAAKQVKYNMADGPARTNAYAAVLDALMWVTHGEDVLRRVID
jgi:hypothetical protein